MLRVLLGALCALTLVVVASALYRMHVYEEAYGFTRLRVLVSVFEAWLGLVIVLTIAAVARLRGPWVPLVALLSGAVMLLASFGVLAWLLEAPWFLGGFGFPAGEPAPAGSLRTNLII